MITPSSEGRLLQFIEEKDISKELRGRVHGAFDFIFRIVGIHTESLWHHTCASNFAV